MPHEDVSTFLLVIVGAFQALIFLVQAGLFIWQLCLFRKSLVDTRITAEAALKTAEATQAGQRAFVTRPYHNQVQSGFNFGVSLSNTGNLATREMSNYIDYCITDERDDLPDYFAFPLNVLPLVIGTMLGPKQEILGPHIPREKIISLDQIEAIKCGEKALFIFGWAKYFDGFGNTPQRFTNFCYKVRVINDPNQPFVYEPYKTFNTTN